MTISLAIGLFYLFFKPVLTGRIRIMILLGWGLTMLYELSRFVYHIAVRIA